eukprot:6530645-Pyramimonas_sp.AAC.1
MALLMRMVTWWSGGLSRDICMLLYGIAVPFKTMFRPSAAFLGRSPRLANATLGRGLVHLHAGRLRRRVIQGQSHTNFGRVLS